MASRFDSECALVVCEVEHMAHRICFPWELSLLARAFFCMARSTGKGGCGVSVGLASAGYKCLHCYS